MFKTKSYHYRNGMWNQSYLWLPLWVNWDKFTSGHSRHRTDCTDGKRHLHIQKGWHHGVHDIHSLRHKMQAYQDNQRSDRVLPWGNSGHSSFQFSAPQWHRLNQERRFLAKSEPGGQTKLDTIPWRLKDPICQKQQ